MGVRIWVIWGLFNTLSYLNKVSLLPHEQSLCSHDLVPTTLAHPRGSFMMLIGEGAAPLVAHATPPNVTSESCMSCILISQMRYCARVYRLLRVLVWRHIQGHIRPRVRNMPRGGALKQSLMPTDRFGEQSQRLRVLQGHSTPVGAAHCTQDC